MCLAPSPTPGPVGTSPLLIPGGLTKPVRQMSHIERMEEAIRRAHRKGQISDEVLAQLPSVKQLVISIAIATAALAALGVAAGAVASTGVGAILEGIAAAIVAALAALGIIASLSQIIAGVKMIARFFEATRVAQTPEDLDAAGKDFATGLAEVGVGTLMLILSMLGARQGIKMGKGAVNRWNAGRAVTEEPVQPASKPPAKSEPKPEPEEGATKAAGPVDRFAELANRRKALGLPPAGDPQDAATLAKLEINGRSFDGINSGLQEPKTTITLERVNAQTKTHAEADAVQKAIDSGMKGSAEQAEMWVDRDPCAACGENGGLRSLARNLGVDELVVHSPSGTQTFLPTK